MTARQNWSWLAALTGALALLFVSTARPAPAATASPVVFVMQRVERVEPGCKKAPSECSNVTLEYPRFTKAPTAAALAALNGGVSDFLLKNLDGKNLPSLNAFIDDFFREAAEARKSVPQMSAWSLEKSVTVDYNTRGIVSLRFHIFEFTGGAHPNSWATLASYAAQTGRRWALKDLLVSGYQSKLNAIAEPYFRKEKELKPNANLEAEGFTFKGGKFAVNDNFMITAKGLLFRFDSYEIAAYVVGPTEFLVPYSAIRHLIRPGGPLTAFR